MLHPIGKDCLPPWKWLPCCSLRYPLFGLEIRQAELSNPCGLCRAAIGNWAGDCASYLKEWVINYCCCLKGKADSTCWCILLYMDIYHNAAPRSDALQHFPLQGLYMHCSYQNNHATVRSYVVGKQVEVWSKDLPTIYHSENCHKTFVCWCWARSWPLETGGPSSFWT